jgi:four helix bundle suffix protein
MASGTSKKTEIKLTNVARASLEELLRDYEGFLRQRCIPIWDKDAPEALAVRQRAKSQPGDLPDPYRLRAVSAEIAGNTLLCLINQASYLLHRQLKRLEEDFLENGGFTEHLHTARTQARARREGNPHEQTDVGDQCRATLACPRCSKPMVRRVARSGANSGQAFWGCSGYPDCKGTRPFRQ